MCRFLAVGDPAAFPIAEQLGFLAEIARGSKEYQGDGWGCAWWDEGGWRTHHSITPIWEDRLPSLGTTTRLVAHARSAFRNEAIVVEHNMPFVEDAAAFAFNGELRGVRLQAAGRIGAEKLFAVVRRMGGDRDTAALAKAAEVVAKRTSYVRAMNFVVATRSAIRLVSRFSEDPEYFTVHTRQAGDRVTICSEPFPAEPGWEAVPNGTVREFATPW
jgi:glutamine amidotransferase